MHHTPDQAREYLDYACENILAREDETIAMLINSSDQTKQSFYHGCLIAFLTHILGGPEEVQARILQDLRDDFDQFMLLKGNPQ